MVRKFCSTLNIFICPVTKKNQIATHFYVIYLSSRHIRIICSFAFPMVYAPTFQNEFFFLLNVNRERLLSIEKEYECRLCIKCRQKSGREFTSVAVPCIKNTFSFLMYIYIIHTYIHTYIAYEWANQSKRLKHLYSFQLFSIPIQSNDNEYYHKPLKTKTKIIFETKRTNT